MDGTWVLFRAAAYLTGRGVTYGNPLIPANAINPNVYSIPIGPLRQAGIAAVDEHLGIFADRTLDHALLMPQIAAHNNPDGLIREVAQKLKVGGHLAIYVLEGVEEPGTKTFYAQELYEVLRGCAHWRVKGEWRQERQLLLVVKKVEGRSGLDLIRTSSGKRACIARYGALGDAIIMTPLIRRLAEDGYSVTLNISGYCMPVLENNPYISNILLQERDLIPNHLLGKYWQTWEAEYDRYINLSESIEGDLLTIEGRGPFFTSRAWRDLYCNKNYYDYTMQRGGYGNATGTKGELYFSGREERKAKEFFTTLKDKFVVVWALNGSSHHKVYPLFQPTLQEWFRRRADVRVITVGDYPAKLLEFDHPQLLQRSGVWTIREALISTKYANLVVGPETMVTNAAGCYPTPKIVLLSHSSRENLTKYFENDHSLTPDNCACYPCHQLHYTKESCPIGEMKDTSNGQVLGQAPVCSISISPQRLLAEMDLVYEEWKNERSHILQ